MSVLGSVLLGLVLLLAAFIGMQVWMVRRMRKSEGRPAPELPGRIGKRIKRGRTAMFYFFSPSCRACKPMTPVIKDLARTREEVVPVDVSRDLDTARKFGVMATPTIVLVRRGIVEKVLVGPQTEPDLRALLG